MENNTNYKMASKNIRANYKSPGSLLNEFRQ